MLAVERRALILSELKEHQTIRVADLSKKCGVTEETIRRDLERLEQSNLLVRTHGGAIAIQSGAEMSFDFRNQQNVREKQQIARKAASTLSRGDTIFLDASTTSLYLAQEISNKTDLTVITNSARIVFELSNKPHITVISTGGILRSTSLSFVGPLTNEAISRYHADKAFLSCKGIDLRLGVTESNELEIEVKRNMMKRSFQAYLLADHSKFSSIGLAKLVSIEEVDYIVTDSGLDQKLQSELAETGKLIIA